MTQDRSFKRKLIYIGLIIVLLVPLTFLSQPAMKPGIGGESDQFMGQLARIRRDRGIASTNLGDIEPTGATMQYALLGLNGLAVSRLSSQAAEFQKKEDWESLRATLEQIVKLQPHYFKVWDYQAHNLAYNLSVEFDDYRARYKQVIVGLNFLKEGIDQNQTEPRLPHKLGWYIAHKIGRADERVLYRRMFKSDYMDLFHKKDDPDRPEEKRDNFLVAREKFLDFARMADSGIEVKTTYLALHFKEIPHSMMSYAETVTEDGDFEHGRQGWADAKLDFEAFSRRLFPTTNAREEVALGDYEKKKDEAEKYKKELEALVPDGRRKFQLERIAKISNEKVRKAVEKPAQERTADEQQLAGPVEASINPTWMELAKLVPEDDKAKRSRAGELASGIVRNEELMREIESNRTPLNYDYWKVRVDVENTEPMQKARELTFKANQLRKSGRVDAAIPKYEEAWCAWRRVFNAYPVMRFDTISADDLNDEINRYREALKVHRQPFPEDFILADIVQIAALGANDPKGLPTIPNCGEDRPKATPAAGNATATENNDAKKPDADKKSDTEKSDSVKSDATKAKDNGKADPAKDDAAKAKSAAAAKTENGKSAKSDPAKSPTPAKAPAAKK